jgi:uncharacterized PurR-regulated membrane protein YhhQ (DUF165 family)
MKGIDWFFSLTGAAAVVSSVLYLVVPGGTIKYFKGVETPTARTWVRTVAAGDIICAYLCYVALYGNAETKKIVVRGFGLYNIFHMGAFLYGHLKDGAHPPSMVGQYISSLIFGSFAAYYWGFYRPPVDEIKLD